MKLILKFLKPYRALTVFVIIAVSLDVAGGLLIPTITADIINYGVGGGNFEYIIRQGLLMALVSLLTGISALVGSSLSASLSAKLGRDIRNAVYDRSLIFSASDMEDIGGGLHDNKDAQRYKHNPAVFGHGHTDDFAGSGGLYFRRLYGFQNRQGHGMASYGCYGAYNMYGVFCHKKGGAAV